MIVNSSRMHTGRSCPCKYCINYKLGIVPKKKAVPLMTGGSVHVGLAGWYASGDPDIPLGMFEGKYRSETKDFWIGEEQEVVEKEIEYGKYMLAEYFKQYPTEPWEMARPESKFKVILGEACWKCEEPYAWAQKMIDTTANSELAKLVCPHCGAPVHLLVGTADLVVSWKGHLWIVEHKTTKQGSSTWIESFKRGTQAMAYVYGISKQLNYRIKGLILNYLKKTKVPEFGRDIFMYEPNQLVQFVKDSIAYCNDTIRWEKEGHWQQYTEECYHWGRCPYIPICNMYKNPLDLDMKLIWSMGYEQKEPDYGDEAYIAEEKRT